MIWHNSNSNDVVNELNSNIEKGLYSEAAKSRIEIYGKNEIKNFSEKSFWHYVLKETKSFLNIALIVLSVILAVLSKSFFETGVFDAIVIILVVFLNILVSSYGKFKRNRDFNDLKGSVIGNATVIRDGEEVTIPASELVPGDIMLLKTGDYVMADARLIDSYALKCDEFKLTGESIPTDKIHDVLFDDITPIEKRHNMVYCGTSVVNGKGVAVVTETGTYTEIGKINKIESQVISSKTQLEQKMDTLGRYAFFTVVVCSFIVFLLGTIVNISSPDFAFATMVIRYALLGLSVCFCAANGILPAIFNLYLTATVRRLEKQNAAITNIKCIDDLKDVNVICTDKTGSLTTGYMSVSKIFADGKTYDMENDTFDDAASTVIRLGLICSNFEHSEHIEKHANNVERAIETSCIKHLGMSKIDIDGIYPKLGEIPFDSERMLMTTVSAINGTPYSIVKGAPEVITEKCNNISIKELSRVADTFAKDGLKVIAVAFKPLPEIPANLSPEELENDLLFAGLIGIEDLADTDALELCKECRENSVKIVMLTGDHLNTALATAMKMGIATDESEALSGEDLAKMSDYELAENINNYSVFARISPEDKLRIVSALKAAGNKVAITGDNLHDTPALIEANVGCALGMTASDMVKDSADIVLTDNRFVSLVSALREINRMHNNVIKTAGNFLSLNAALVLVILLGLIIFGTSPVSAATLLVISVLSTPMLLGIALDNRSQPLGVKKSINLLNKDFLVSTIIPTIITAALALISFGLCKADGKELAFTAVFAVLVVCNFASSFKVCFQKTALSLEIVGHVFVNIFAVITVILVVIFLFTPIGNLLYLTTLNSTAWIMLLISFVVHFFADEIIKLVLKK